MQQRERQERTYPPKTQRKKKRIREAKSQTWVSIVSEENVDEYQQHVTPGRKERLVLATAAHGQALFVIGYTSRTRCDCLDLLVFTLTNLAFINQLLPLTTHSTKV